MRLALVAVLSFVVAVSALNNVILMNDFPSRDLAFGRSFLHSAISVAAHSKNVRLAAITCETADYSSELFAFETEPVTMHASVEALVSSSESVNMVSGLSLAHSLFQNAPEAVHNYLVILASATQRSQEVSDAILALNADGIEVIVVTQEANADWESLSLLADASRIFTEATARTALHLVSAPSLLLSSQQPPASNDMDPIQTYCVDFCSYGYGYRYNFTYIDCADYCSWDGRNRTGVANVTDSSSIPENKATLPSMHKDYTQPGELPDVTFRTALHHTLITPTLGLSGTYDLMLGTRLRGTCQDTPLRDLQSLKLTVNCPSDQVGTVAAQADYSLVNCTRGNPTTYAGWPQVRLWAKWSIPSWLNVSRPLFSWKVVRAVTPTGANITQALYPTLVNAQSPDFAYVQPRRPGNYTIEVAMLDGCRIIKSSVLVQAACNPLSTQVDIAPDRLEAPRINNQDHYAAFSVNMAHSMDLTQHRGLSVELMSWPGQAAGVSATASTIGNVLSWELADNRPETVLEQSSTSTSETQPTTTTDETTAWRSQNASWPFIRTQTIAAMREALIRPRLRTTTNTVHTHTVNRRVYIPGSTANLCVAQMNAPALTSGLGNIPDGTATFAIQVGFTEVGGPVEMRTNCSGAYLFRFNSTNPDTTCQTTYLRDVETVCGQPPHARFSEQTCFAKSEGLTIDFKYNSGTFGGNFPSLALESESVDAMPAEVSSQLTANGRSLVRQWTWTGFPSGSAVDASNCLFSQSCGSAYTAQLDRPGDYTVELAVSTGCAIDRRTALLKGRCPNQPVPTIGTPSGSASSTAIYMQEFPVTVTQNWSPAPVYQYTYSIQSPAVPAEYAPYVSAPALQANGNHVQVTPGYNGAHTLTATVTDGCATAVASKDFTVTCPATPTPTYNVPTTATAGQTVTMDASTTDCDKGSSTLPCQVTHYWAVVAQPAADTTVYPHGDETASFSFTPVMSGTYKVRIVSTDGCKWTSVDKPIAVSCTSPSPLSYTDLTASSTTGFQPADLITITATATGQVGNPTYRLVSNSSAADLSATSATTFSFRAAQTGNFLVEVAYTDGCNAPVAKTISLTATCPAAPTVAFAGPSELHAFSTMTNLTITSAIPDGYTAQWSLVAASSRHMVQPLATYFRFETPTGGSTRLYIEADADGYYPAKGAYTVQLRLIDPAHPSSPCRTASLTVNVVCPPISYDVLPREQSAEFMTAFVNHQVLQPTFQPYNDTSLDQFWFHWLFASAPTGSKYAPQTTTEVTQSSTNVPQTDVYSSNTTEVVTIDQYESTLTKEYRVYFHTRNLCFAPDLPGDYDLRFTPVYGRYVPSTEDPADPQCVYDSVPVKVSFPCAAAPSAGIGNLSQVLLPRDGSTSFVDLDALAASESLYYRWTILAAPTNATQTCSAVLSDPLQAHAQLAIYLPGTYTVQLEVSNGCSVSSTTASFVAIFPEVPLVAAVWEATNGTNITNQATWYRHENPHTWFPLVPAGSAASAALQWRVVGFTATPTPQPLSPASVALIVGLSVGLGGTALIAAVVVVIVILCCCRRRGGAPSTNQVSNRLATPSAPTASILTGSYAQMSSPPAGMGVVSPLGAPGAYTPPMVQPNPIHVA
ncbi:hypothetical protein PAPYR_1043 [Paratrimastix pyriformis]|uniref:Membrane-associated protein n=1 Tax=Paratrimastix pyriformis TaxID=342808 RepID=A0ABQ8UVC9_9EUKA|nr:hypothetical protein PAPYR_1043 [Paratrimastix pyriformis]|eukprot:GAFH01000702.1.p1 GENE.GAFH01000702.1~~GAFH01000702.1.p1  ORF type:complete len:1623 (+),score=643.47 GAFH01000702.1:41-4870(+)